MVVLGNLVAHITLGAVAVVALLLLVAMRLVQLAAQVVTERHHQ